MRKSQRVSVFSGVWLAAAALACEPAGHDRIEVLGSRVDSLALTLAHVTERLNRGAVPAVETLTVSGDGAAQLGQPGAPITIVEFTDFQCPFCARHATTTLPRLDSTYIKRGQVRYVVRDLPLAFHPLARPAAIAARCAASQSEGAYWRFHDAVFAAQEGLDRSSLDRIARDVGLDRRRFDACVESEAVAAAVDADAAEASRLGLTGTPAFVIGPSTADSVRGIRVRGAQPYDRFEAIINELLAGSDVALRE